MPTIVLDIPSGTDLTRAVDAVCGLYNYQTLINGSANPESRNSFAKRMLATILKEKVIQWEQNVAMDAARVSAGAVVIT